MQKSKIANITVIFMIFIYSLFAINHSPNSNNLYLYVINPLFWILLAFALQIFMKGIYKKRLKKEIINYSMSAALIYIVIYLLSGLIVTFGKNPYATNLHGFTMNIWIFRKCDNI